MRRTAVALALAAAAFAPPAAHAATRAERVTGSPAVHEVMQVAVSKDGRYAAVAGYATAPPVVAGTHLPNVSGAPVVGPAVTQVEQVYLVDRTAHTTTLLSAVKGVPGDKDSTSPSISADGRYVVFQSAATNLTPRAPGVIPQYAAFLYDRVTRRLTLASVDWRGVEIAEGIFFPSISADGSTIVFASDGAVVRGGQKTGGTGIFARDRKTGRAWVVSRRRNGSTGRAYGINGVAVNRTGRYVAVIANALLGGDAGPEATSLANVYLFDTKTGAAKLVRGAVSDDPARCPQQAYDAKACSYTVATVAISPDGSHVGYSVSTDAFGPVSERALSVDVTTGTVTTLGWFPEGTFDSFAYTLDGLSVYFVSPPRDSSGLTGSRVLYRAHVTSSGTGMSQLPVTANCRADGCATLRLASVSPYAGGVAFTTDAPLTQDDSDGLMDAYVFSG